MALWNSSGIHGCSFSHLVWSSLLIQSRSSVPSQCLSYCFFGCPKTVCPVPFAAWPAYCVCAASFFRIPAQPTWLTVVKQSLRRRRLLNLNLPQKGRQHRIVSPKVNLSSCFQSLKGTLPPNTTFAPASAVPPLATRGRISLLNLVEMVAG